MYTLKLLHSLKAKEIPLYKLTQKKGGGQVSGRDRDARAAGGVAKGQERAEARERRHDVVMKMRTTVILVVLGMCMFEFVSFEWTS